MRIYTNEITWSTIFDAARKAGVTIDRNRSFTPRVGQEEGGYDFGFDITLRGDSRRSPNYGTGPRGYDEKAATWDQWGVFLSWLLHIDNYAKIGGLKYPYYNGSADFDYKTDGRFSNPGVMPDDAHGDHTFRFDGTSQSCTKCSARVRR